jgi:hypothetical protein
MDSLISKELQEMSFQDRNTTSEEIHGILPTGVTNEDPEAVKRSLDLLQDELEKMDSRIKVSFNRALSMGSSLVIDPAFRLRFLRATRYDVPLAATRLVKYMGMMERWFGPELLCRLPETRDLGKDAMDILREGSIQPLSCRDAAGRRIVARFDHIGLGKLDADRVRVPSVLDKVSQFDCAPFCSNPGFDPRFRWVLELIPRLCTDSCLPLPRIAIVG